MKDFVENYKDIRLCAHVSEDQIRLYFAVVCPDGKWRTITTDVTYRAEIHYARVYGYDALKNTEKVVNTPAELTEFVSLFKPTDAPSIALYTAEKGFVRLAKVSPKGTIGVHYHTDGYSHYKDIPLPQDGTVITDASIKWNDMCYVHWNLSDALENLWDRGLRDLKRLQDFCKREKEKEDKELAVGATRIDALLKFQENAKTIEEKISEKWNSMSTEDKAKALKIGKKK
jgi:hypothetical protein